MFNTASKTSKSVTAQKSAEKAVSLFSQAINELEESTSLAISTAEENAIKIQELQTESDSMNKLVESNKKIIDNIKTLIGV